MTQKYDLKKMAEILEKMELTRAFLESHFIFENTWKENLQLREFLNNPVFSLEDKLATLQQIFDQKLCRAFQEYVLLLLTNHDILKYPNLSEKLLKYFTRDYLLTNVISAQVLTAEQLNKINILLEKKTQKKVVLRQELQPQILGGLIIKFSDSILDLSLRHRLEQLQLSLR